ncbi:MAG: mandelate racemase/muconate lactonizing enzyme family protein [Armatimonadetes bacterium]|nr:mandelate racemase/muconate lactonizing enzyme family protein [Armatimonadota bacterium]
MKITSYDTYLVGNPWKNWVFLVLHTDEGIDGVGEGTVHGFARPTEAVIRELDRFFLGSDPFQIEIITQKMVRDLFSEGGQVHKGAVAAVEVACWDIIGKALGQPIHNFLGGRCHEKIRAYANGWYRGERQPEAFAELAQKVAARGYTALKFDPFGAAWMAQDRLDEDLSIDIIAAVREAVGTQVDLFVEGHCRFTVAQAIKLAERMAPCRPSWFEEPVPHQHIPAMAEVARHSPVPIATGESFSSLHQFAELMDHNVVSIYQPEIHHLGGILAARKVCAMAEAHYAVVAPHNAQGPVSTAMCLQLAACTPNFYVQEIFDEFNVEWEQRLIDHPAHVVDGYLEIPERPGLGVSLNLEEARKHPYEKMYFLPLFKPGWERREGE